jgi:hypothetical protein
MSTVPALTLGSAGPADHPQPLIVPLDLATTHWHIIGASGSGKSRFLAALYLSLLRAGLPAMLIDPHGDLAQLVLAYLVAAGVYRTAAGFERVLYLDLPAAARAGRYLPLNVLRQHGSPHTVAANIKEAFHRAWPSLAGGTAPMFDTLVQDGVKVLISNDLPITALYKLLTDKPFRDACLAVEEDEDIVTFFHDQFDRLSVRDQADQAGAALRRAHLLTFSPVLKYSLSQRHNALPMREILDLNRSVIVNLALGDADARRLLGCLLTVSIEQAALSRADVPATARGGPYFLCLDEFAEFSAQSEDALARMLSLTRKYGLFLVMSHQSWSQASERLRGALGNVGVEVVFRLGRADAEYSASVIGRVDPLAVKHEIPDATAAGRGHPVFFSPSEQREQSISAIQDLAAREAFIRLPGGVVRPFRTLAVPDPAVDPDELAAVEAHYLATCFRPPAEADSNLTGQTAGADGARGPGIPDQGPASLRRRVPRPSRATDQGSDTQAQ